MFLYLCSRFYVKLLIYLFIMEQVVELDKVEMLLQKLLDYGVEFGKKLLVALVIYFVGRYLVRLLKNLSIKMMDRRNVAPEVKSFVGSIVAVCLNVLLIISVIGALGIETTSFAALLASAGVAIGMALSGQMQNFAGGVLILLQRPYKIGDFIETNGTSGTVQSIQIFSTRLSTVDNKIIIIPNGSITSNVMVNYSDQDMRRVDFSFGVEYGEDVEKVRRVLNDILTADKRIETKPAPFIGLGQLADSSVNITVRVWAKSSDYWDVYFQTNEKVYNTFNKEGIGFPFPQMTVHQAKD